MNNINTEMIDAYQTIKIIGELLDESGGDRILSTEYHWSLNSLWNDAMMIYVNGIMRGWKNKNQRNH